MLTHWEQQKSFAREMEYNLRDTGSFLYYYACTKTYPKAFLEDTLAYVSKIPEELLTVAKSSLFKIIVGMAFVEDDD